MTTYFNFYKTKSKYKSKIIILQSLYNLSNGKSRRVCNVYDHLFFYFYKVKNKNILKIIIIQSLYNLSVDLFLTCMQCA
jgi:hypothetical protein